MGSASVGDVELQVLGVGASRDLVTERLSVQGMSCAACVGKVEKCLMSMSGMHTVSVSLLTESAVVEFDKSAVNVAAVLKKIESLGYTANHIEQREAGRVRLFIDAMTSAACGAKVEEALQASAGVHSVELALLTSSAVILFDPTRTGPRFLLECLAQIGLSAELQQLDATNELQKNQAKELRNWKRRLLVSMVFTVPAFIVCMVLPMSGLEKQLMYRVNGYVDLSAIICGLLAFPVQVGLLHSLCSRAVALVCVRVSGQCCVQLGLFAACVRVHAARYGVAHWLCAVRRWCPVLQASLQGTPEQECYDGGADRHRDLCRVFLFCFCGRTYLSQ
jgi:copper ion binding protein